MYIFRVTIMVSSAYVRTMDQSIRQCIKDNFNNVEKYIKCLFWRALAFGGFLAVYTHTHHGL